MRSKSYSAINNQYIVCVDVLCLDIVYFLEIIRCCQGKCSQAHHTLCLVRLTFFRCTALCSGAAGFLKGGTGEGNAIYMGLITYISYFCGPATAETIFGGYYF